MLGCSLEEAFGKQKKKRDNPPLHANTIARSKMNGGQSELDNRLKNRIDKDIIIQETTNLEESKNTDSEINNNLVSKLNVILDRLDHLENNFKEMKINKNENKTTVLPYNKLQSTNQIVEPPPQPPPQPMSTNNKSTPINSLMNNNSMNNNTIKNLLELKNLRNNNSNNSSNIFSNLVNDSLIEGFSNNNISYIGNQFNELLLFGLMGLFILLLFDYIYKLGKKTY